MIAEELKKLYDRDEPYMGIEEASEYTSLSVSFLEKHKEIPRTFFYPRCPKTGQPMKKAVVRFQKHALAAYMRGEI